VKKLIAIASVLVLTLAGCSSDTSDQAATVETPVEQVSGSIKCTESDAKGKTVSTTGAPGSVLKTFPKTFTLETNCGTIVIEPFGDKAPLTVTSFAHLASKNFFDNTICHRLTTEGIYVLQCGDPTGTGAGQSFYKFADENLPEPITNNYPAGTVAMANSGPSSNFSQFFLVYQDTTLGPDYTIWGKITKGLDVVQYIAKQGLGPTQGSGQPANPGDSMPKKTVEIISFR
jgi:peptidyl-prolyl cis-trans isomerase B (cyclophilin B)